jgi:diadenosine tetraphosphate (Ap4A) HIT family hydrolase
MLCFGGLGVVVFDRRHVTRLDELSVAEWQSYAAYLHRVVTATGAVCRPDHFNIESLGNIVPHVHWHVIPRYRNDGRWGQPIWAQDVNAQPDRRLADDDRARLLRELAAAS